MSGSLERSIAGAFYHTLWVLELSPLHIAPLQGIDSEFAPSAITASSIGFLGIAKGICQLPVHPLTLLGTASTNPAVFHINPKEKDTFTQARDSGNQGITNQKGSPTFANEQIFYRFTVLGGAVGSA